MRRVAILLLSLLLSGTLSAQMVLIPQSVRDSINNPTTVADSPLLLVGGKSVQMGRIAEDGGEWSGVAVLQNRGRRPIVITRLTTTCGCLQAEPAEREVKAGESVELKLTFNPRGRIGVVGQRVMVYTSLSDTKPTLIVELVGQVVAAANREADYPYSRGALMLRSDRVEVDGAGVVRVACYNAGDVALTLSADGLLTTEGVSVTTEPMPLAPKSEGDLVIRLNKAIEEGVVYLKGLNIAPRQSKIELIKREK